VQDIQKYDLTMAQQQLRANQTFSPSVAVWKTEEELEQEAIKLQKWQRDKFARELGFDPDTKDKSELADIDRKYEDMLRYLTHWSRRQQNRKEFLES
jgi:hypothetical protein